MTSAAKPTSVTVAVVQAGSVPFDTEACVDKAVRLIADATAHDLGVGDGSTLTWWTAGTAGSDR